MKKEVNNKGLKRIKRNIQQKPSFVEHARTPAKEMTIQQQKKKKLVVWFADAPEPLVIKVKLDTKNGKPLVITIKSSKSVNAASSIDHSFQAVPIGLIHWWFIMWKVNRPES